MYIIITLVGNGEISMIFKMIGRNIAIVTQVWLKGSYLRTIRNEETISWNNLIVGILSMCVSSRRGIIFDFFVEESF